MEFKFTFEDGSEAIAHYGVKGMKWGKWNAETAARYNLEGANVGGGGSIDEDEDPEETTEQKEAKAAEQQKQLDAKNAEARAHIDETVRDRISKGDLVGAIKESANASGGDYRSGIAALVKAGAEYAANSEAGKSAKSQVDRLVSSAQEAKDLMNRADSMSDSDRNTLRQQAREEKKKRVAEKREAAKANGDPFWFLITK